MRAASVMRFVVLGAIGFGIGGASASLLAFHLPGGVGLLLGPLVGGAVGGGSLGLALKDFRRVLILALLGALGLTVGVMAGLILGSFFSYAAAPVAVIVGAVVGASLGVAFKDWRTIVALVVAGAVGFSVGNLADLIRFSVPIIKQLGETGSIAITGIIGGASLGAALGYLERRKLVAERRSRVR
jgi:hypothetical protein